MCTQNVLNNVHNFNLQPLYCIVNWSNIYGHVVRGKVCGIAGRAQAVGLATDREHRFPLDVKLNKAVILID